MKKILMRFTLPTGIILIIGMLFLWDPSLSYLRAKKVDNYAQMEKQYKNGQLKMETSFPLLTYTGYDCKKNNKKIGSYYYSFIDNYCIFILVSMKEAAPNNISNYKVKAVMEPSSYAYEQMLEGFTKDINWTRDKLTMISSSFYISEVDYPYGQLYIIIGCFFIAIVAAVILFIIDIRQLIRLKSQESGIDGI